MAAAQRKRWAVVKKESGVVAKTAKACCQEAETQTKRGGPGREIIDATKKHWAAVRAAAARDEIAGDVIGQKGIAPKLQMKHRQQKPKSSIPTRPRSWRNSRRATPEPNGDLHDLFIKTRAATHGAGAP